MRPRPCRGSGLTVLCRLGTDRLSDGGWVCLEAALDAARSGTGRPLRDERQVVEAVIWRRNGAEWRALPSEFGPWRRAAPRPVRWSRTGVRERAFERLRDAGRPELGEVLLEGTSVRRPAATTAGWVIEGGTRRRRRADERFRGRRFEGRIVLWAVRWCCKYGVSYREREEMLEERGVELDRTTIYRWVQRHAPEIEKRLRWYWRRPSLCRRWRVGETYVKVRGRRAHPDRAAGRRGDAIEAFLPPTRNAEVACPARWLGRVRVEATDGRTLRGRADEPGGIPATRRRATRSTPRHGRRPSPAGPDVPSDRRRDGAAPGHRRGGADRSRPCPARPGGGRPESLEIPHPPPSPGGRAPDPIRDPGPSRRRPDPARAAGRASRPRRAGGPHAGWGSRRQRLGPSAWIDRPVASTATVTGMSSTVSS